MHTARIVADHAAKCVVIVRRRIGSKRQMMFLGGIAQYVQNAARFDTSKLLIWIEIENAVEIFGKINQDRGIARLPAKACTASP